MHPGAVSVTPQLSLGLFQSVSPWLCLPVCVCCSFSPAFSFSAPSPFPCSLLSTLPLSHAGLTQTQSPVLPHPFPAGRPCAPSVPSLASGPPSAKQLTPHRSLAWEPKTRLTSMEGSGRFRAL